jgi:hypothetical protein
MVTSNEQTEPRYPRNPGFTGSKKNNGEEGASLSDALKNVADTARELLQSKPARVMKEREAPILFEFKAPGDFLEGELLSFDKIKITDRDTKQPKMVIQYTFASGEKTVKCLGTYDLNTKLRPSDVGLWVEITFKDTDTHKNNMRIFSVKIEEKPKAAAFSDGTQITDEDIPF